MDDQSFMEDEEVQDFEINGMNEEDYEVPLLDSWPDVPSLEDLCIRHILKELAEDNEAKDQMGSLPLEIRMRILKLLKYRDLVNNKTLNALLSHGITELDLSTKGNCSPVITSDLLLHIATQFTSIESLLLFKCVFLSDVTVRVITENLKNLRHFDIRGCVNVTDVSISHIANNSFSLNILKLGHLPNTTCQTFDILTSNPSFFSSLEVLDISECHWLTPDCLSRFLNSSVHKNLGYVKYYPYHDDVKEAFGVDGLRYWSNVIPKDHLFAAAMSSFLLKKETITCMSIPSKLQEKCQLEFPNLRRVKLLDIKNSEQIFVDGFSTWKQLRELTIHFPYLYELPSSIFENLEYQNLQKLTLYDPSNDIVKMVLKKFPLKVLKLHSASEPDVNRDDIFTSMTRGDRWCQGKLRKLVLSGPFLVTNHSIKMIAQCVPELTSFHLLNEYDGITNCAVGLLSQMPALRHLDLRGTKRINELGIQYFRTGFPSLQSLAMDDLFGITLEGFCQVEEICKVRGIRFLFSP